LIDSKKWGANAAAWEADWGLGRDRAGDRDAFAGDWRGEFGGGEKWIGLDGGGGDASRGEKGEKNKEEDEEEAAIYFCFVFYFWGGDEDEGRRKGVAIFDTATHTSYPAICNSSPMGYGLEGELLCLGFKATLDMSNRLVK
jgi:hypothetical protein